MEKERESAGLKASLKTLASNVERLENLCVEWNEAEETLRKKWKIIEEFDARRLELETIYTTFIQANLVNTFFFQHLDYLKTFKQVGTELILC